MKIIDELINQEILDKYKNELFIFNETLDNLKDKRVVKLVDGKGQVVCIAMYSQLDTEEVELYLNQEQQESIGKLLSNGIYLDSIYSLMQGKKYSESVITYLKEKFNRKAIWCYSAIDAMDYWKHRKDFSYQGENIFISL